MNLRIPAICLLFTALAVAGFARGGAEPAGDQVKPETLKVATAFTLNTEQELGFRMFMDKVETRLADRIELNYTGGPEAINPFELIEAVRSGIVDVAGLPGSYFQSTVDETASMYLSRITPAKERANGAYEIYRKAIADKANSHYLGRYNTSYKFNFYSKVPLRTMDDFEGVKFRVSPVYKAFLTELDATPVTMPHSEIYTALERGLVEAVGVTNFGVIERGWNEKVNYIVDPSFYGSDQVILVNLDTWNKLSPEVQEGLAAIVIEVESESGIELLNVIEKERLDLVEAGLQVITVGNPNEYLRIAYDAAWTAILEAIPQTGKQLKDLISAN
jgi:TRAP-type C4-dicarboxylate transport system substrate-binding protein